MYGGGVSLDNKWRAPKDDCAIKVRTKKRRGYADEENDEVHMLCLNSNKY